MKRFISVILICSMLLCSCANNKSNTDSSETNQSQLESASQAEESETNKALNETFESITELTSQTEKSNNKTNTNKKTQLKAETVSQTEEKLEPLKEIRGVWISCFELPDATKGEAQFRESIKTIFKNLREKDYNTVFVHVRPFADSIYPSKIFPWSKHCCKGKNPSFDPLKIIVQTAKENRIRVHAWIYPFRVSSKNDVNTLPASSPSKKMIENNSSDVVILPNGIYFNPASTSVHKLVYSGVEEILKNYDIDGIHIDDYFYPTTDEKIDKKEYEEYKKLGGALTLTEWR